MIDLQKVENKPSNGQSPYYLIGCKNTLIDGTNLPFSQPVTPEILATPFSQQDTLNPTCSTTVENQINSFVSSNTEPQDTGFLD